MVTEEQIDGERKIVAWNAKVGRPVGTVLDNLHNLIQDHDPQVIVLQEFHEYLGKARDRYEDKWWLYGHNDWQYANNCPVMVRKATHNKQDRHDGWDSLRTTVNWHGPKGKVFDGRTWTYVKTNSAWFLSLHRCTNGPTDNPKAFAEEFDTLKRWADNHKGLPICIIGDHNIGATNDAKDGSKRLAEAIGGKVIADGGVDYAVVRDFKGSLKHGKKYGSDHEAIILTRK